MERLDFSVEIGEAIHGISGIVHVFDLVAVRSDVVLFLDLANLDETVFMRALSRTADIRPATLFLISNVTYASNLPNTLKTC